MHARAAVFSYGSKARLSLALVSLSFAAVPLLARAQDSHPPQATTPKPAPQQGGAAQPGSAPQQPAPGSQAAGAGGQGATTSSPGAAATPAKLPPQAPAQTEEPMPEQAQKHAQDQLDQAEKDLRYAELHLTLGGEDAAASERQLEEAQLRVAQWRLVVTQSKEDQKISDEHHAYEELQNARNTLSDDTKKHAAAAKLQTDEENRLQAVSSYQNSRRQRIAASERRFSAESEFRNFRDDQIHRRLERQLNADVPCPGYSDVTTEAQQDVVSQLGVEDRVDARILTIIFNRRTNQLWRYNPTDHTEYRRVHSFGLLPSARSNEQVMLLICGEHFGNVATVTPTVVNLPDVSSALYTGVPDVAVPAAAGAPAADQGNQKLMNLRLESVPPKTPPPPAAGACTADQVKKLNTDIDDISTKLTAFQAAESAFQTSEEYHTYLTLHSGAFSTSNISRELDRVAGEEPRAYRTVGAFNDTAKDLQAAMNDAMGVAANLVSASKGDSWSALKKAGLNLIASIQTYQTDRDVKPECVWPAGDLTHGDGTAGDALVDIQSALEPSDTIIRELTAINDRISRLYSLLNLDYRLSNTMDKSMVDFSSANAIITQKISISDNWVPFPNPTFTQLPSLGAGTPAAAQNTAGQKAAQQTAAPLVALDPGASVNRLSIVTTSSPPSPSAQATAVPQTAAQTPAPSPQQGANSQQSSANTATNKIQGAATTTVQSGQTASADAEPSIWRKLFVHFVATGGAFAAHEPTDSYSSVQVPTSVTTATMTTTSVTTAAGVTTTSVDNSTSTTASTEYLAFRTGVTGWHPGALVGLTWFPGGMDTYSYSPRRRVYGSLAWFRNFGLFLGSTVNTTGSFTFGPAYQIEPGFEVLVGGTLLTSDRPSPAVVTCQGLGSTLTGGPATTATTNNNDVDSSGNRTVTVTTTATATQSYCVNSNATVLSGATITTQSDNRVGFTFGVLFNSNLWRRSVPNSAP